MTSTVTVDEVLHSVTPRICVDRPTLGRLLRERPHPEAVVPLISDPDAEVVRAAIVYLGVFGSMRDCPLLALCLQHDDEGVAGAAEYALWSIWMQAGSPDGNGRLARAIGRIKCGHNAQALDELSALVVLEPDFAEAHFQRGIALSMLERQEEAAQAYRTCLRLNPYHFGAAAALGHVSVELGNLPGALHYYRRALQIHPRLDDLPRAVRELESAAKRC